MSAEASEVSAQAQAAQSQPSQLDRMKSILSAPSNVSDAGTPSPSIETERAQTRSASGDTEDGAETKPVPTEAAAEEDRAEVSEDGKSDDAQSEEWKPSNLTELIEAAGLDSDKGFDLELPVKIDGKEGTARLRDLVKSYQLDGHINQKLETLNTDRKTFESERQAFQGERADKLLRLDAGVQTLERALLGEFQAIDWNKLAAEDPAAYNARFVDFQQRNAYLSDIGQQIAHERGQQQQTQKQAEESRLAEERRLLLAKVPEWSNETARAKDKADIMAYLETQGITKPEFEAMTDHRIALVARDAWKWNQLQKSKPATLNKVKAAPKLLKPGSPQSKAAQDTARDTKARDRFRQTGSVRDGAAVLKGLLQ